MTKVSIDGVEYRVRMTKKSKLVLTKTAPKLKVLERYPSDTFKGWAIVTGSRAGLSDVQPIILDIGGPLSGNHLCVKNKRGEPKMFDTAKKAQKWAATHPDRLRRTT